MSTYSCDLLRDEITFFHNQIQSCCSSQLGPVYYQNFDEKKINTDLILKIKKDAFEQIKSGDIPKNCQGCFNLKSFDGKDFSPKFSRLIISHWVHCNCSCVYCARNEFSIGKVTHRAKNSDYYDMLPILREMYAKDLLVTDNNLFVDFQGGDISVLEEFNDILEELMAHNVGYIRFTTNNIVYQPLIAELLKKGKAELMTSLDCGCRETYLKLKRVDKFEHTISNLKKYKESCKNAYIFVKYITVKGINDNVDEVNKFLDLMFEIGIPTVSFEIDYRDIMMHPEKKFEIPAHYYDLLELFRKRCYDNDTQLTLFTHTENVMQQGWFGKDI